MPPIEPEPEPEPEVEVEVVPMVPEVPEVPAVPVEDVEVEVEVDVVVVVEVDVDALEPPSGTVQAPFESQKPASPHATWPVTTGFEHCPVAGSQAPA